MVHTMINFDRLAVDLCERLDRLLSDYAEALAGAKHGLTVERGVGVAISIPVVLAEVRRFFADQVNPPGPCLRPGCGHPADWHRLDDAQNVGPGDPGALFRCLGYDVHAPGKPERRCDCPDYVRQPDVRPDGYVGRWPPVCQACGHRHTPGERCADHVWTDACPYNAGTYCGRPELLPGNVPPCGIVAHVGCTWNACVES